MKLKLHQLILFIGIFLCGIAANSFAASPPKHDSIPVVAIFLKNGDIIQVKDVYCWARQKIVAYDPFDEKPRKSKLNSCNPANYKKQIPMETVEQIKFINGLVFYQDPDFHSTKMQGKVKYTHYFLDSERYYYRDEELDAYYATIHIAQTSKKCQKIYNKANIYGIIFLLSPLIVLLLALIIPGVFWTLLLLPSLILLFKRNNLMKKAVDVYNSEQGY